MTNYRPKTLFMVIEHDPATADLIVGALAKRFGSGCTIVYRTMAELREIKLDQFNAALCNIELPGGDGLAALRVLLSRRNDLPVIMLTSESRVCTALDAIRIGAYDFIVQSPGMYDLIPLVIEKNLEISRIKQENHRLQEDLSESVDRVQESNSRLAEMVLQLEEMASTDSLTGLRNRRHIPVILQQMLAESDRYGADLSAIMIDIDDFKQINDTLGHQEGDAMLVVLGEIIQRNIRKADVAVRYGGDEFMILMPHTDADTAAALAMRIVNEYDEITNTAIREHAERPRGTISAGISSCAIDQPKSGDELIAHADCALYAAKTAGKNRIMLSQSGRTHFREINSSHNRRASA